jgi:invasion protein IalB
MNKTMSSTLAAALFLASAAAAIAQEQKPAGEQKPAEAAKPAAAAAAQPQQAGGLPRGWFKVCAKQEDNDICNVQNIVAAETGQLVTGISLIELKGKVNRKLFQVTVPTGRVIPAGVGMQIDGGKTVQIPYAICLQDRCIAEAQLTDDLVARFKKGNELTLTSINFQNKPNPVKVALSGFTQAFDGEGLKQSEIEDRQKQLATEIEKRKKEFEDKLKAEQQKAKTP